MSDLRKPFKFFHEYAGYCVGHKAEGAISLARAERARLEAEDEGVASIEWVDDPEPYDHGFLSDEEVAAKFESNEWTGPYGCVLRVGDDVVASLWGIVLGQWGTNDPYARVVEAELSEEARDEIRQALGDARDMREEIPA